jgi:DNA-binding CsgD family transcriptional regulator/tetratricopeptide (TPR) repeat protein
VRIIDGTRTAGDSTGAAARSTPIRGRVGELVVIDELITGLRAGSGSVLVIEGPPGIGKSRLLSEVNVRGAAAGARVVPAKAFEDQQTVPFAPLLAAFLRGDPPIGREETLRNLAIEADLRYWMVRELQAAIGAVARTQPLAVTIDDAHWADAGTVAVLRELMNGLADTAVLWAITARTGAGTAAFRATIDAVTGTDRQARTLRLDGVDAGAVADIAKDALRSDVDASVLVLAGMAQGNPYLILELLRGLNEEGKVEFDGGRATAKGDVVPQRVATTIVRRLDALSPEARQAIQVASILPEHFSASLLARMLERSPSSLVDVIAEAVRADLLTESGDHLRFQHELHRHATRQSIPLTLRRAMERESATVLLRAGAAPEEVATQLARSADVGDRDAVTTLRQAAESLSRSDPSAAADLSGRALELLRSDDEFRSAVVAETVRLLNRAGRYEEAQRLVTSTLSVDLPAEEEAQIRLSMSMSSSRGPGERAEENRRSLSLPDVSAPTRAQHLSWLAYNLMMDGQVAAARAAATEAVDAPDGDRSVALLAALTRANIDCAEGDGLGALDQLAEVRRRVRAAAADVGVVGRLATFHRANVLLTLGRLTEAADVIERGLRTARPGDDIAAFHGFTLLKALHAVAAGKLGEARELVESPAGAAGSNDHGVSGLIHAQVICELALRTDDRPMLRTAGIAARRLLERGPARRRAGLFALAGMAWHREDVAAAREYLAAGEDVLGPPLWSVDLDHVVLAARIADATDDADIRRRAMTAATVLDHDGGATPLFAAVSGYTRALLQRDADGLIAAMSRLADCGRPLLSAAAGEDAGHALLRRGKRDVAAESLSAAFDAYAGADATADARRVARTLQRLGVERRVIRPRVRTGLQSLTQTEWRVADLVTAGATNRQVAQRLSVSPHTVNTHLRNIYGKLGIRSREQLTLIARGE